MNRELGDNRMESEHKMWVWLVGIGATIGLCIALLVQAGEAIKVNAGLQECKYAVVGLAGTVTAWMKECPKSGIGPVVIDSETVK